MQIDRDFVRIDEGQVHMRRYSRAGDRRVPLVLLHASPGSSIGLVSLMEELAKLDCPPLVALDTLGNGDSAAPTPDAPDIAYFADASLRAVSAMGIDQFHLYGSMTGARTACDMALQAPERLDCVILDGMGEYDPDFQRLLIAEYAPEMAPSDYGYQLLWAFNFVRDQALHFPYFLRDPEHRLMTRPVAGAEELHLRTVEVLKALTTYHKSYRAAFVYPGKARLAELSRPVTFIATEGDKATLAETHALAGLVSGAEVVVSAIDPAAKAKAIMASLG